MQNEEPDRFPRSRIELIERIGGGAEGKVWKAKRRHVDGTEEVVAVKFLSVPAHDLAVLKRIRSEARILQSLEHESIVKYRDFVFLEGEGYAAPVPCLVMEYLQGEDLKRHLQSLNGRGMQWERVRHVAIACLQALIYARSRGVTHCDIKPSNIFLCSDNTVKIIDFGIARWDSICSDATSTTISVGGLRGSYNYMAPDFARLNRFSGDEQSDIFSFGVCLFEMLYGRLPFEAFTDDPLKNYFLRWAPHAPIVTPAFPKTQSGDPCAVLPGLRDLLGRCLEVDRARRFSSFNEVLDGLTRIQRLHYRTETGKVYECLRYIGSGGFGVVYEATDRSSGQIIALKVLSKDIHAKRLVHEARLLQQHPHRNIVGYYDFFTINAKPEPKYGLAMELLPGMPEASLQQRMRRLPSRALPLPVALDLFDAYLSALEHLHKKGIYHRDIKPSNLYAPENGDREPCLFDFGVAIDPGRETLTKWGVPGTPDYMPPEFASQAKRRDASGVNRLHQRGSAQSDIFSLGVCFYEAVVGHLPFPKLPQDPSAAWAEYFRRASRLPSPSFDHPLFRQYPLLRKIVQRALANDPGARYESAEAFRLDLAKLRQLYLECEESVTKENRPTVGQTTTGSPSFDIRDAVSPRDRWFPRGARRQDFDVSSAPTQAVRWHRRVRAPLKFVAIAMAATGVVGLLFWSVETRARNDAAAWLSKAGDRVVLNGPWLSALMRHHNRAAFYVRWSPFNHKAWKDAWMALESLRSKSADAWHSSVVDLEREVSEGRVTVSAALITLESTRQIVSDEDFSRARTRIANTLQDIYVQNARKEITAIVTKAEEATDASTLLQCLEEYEAWKNRYNSLATSDRFEQDLQRIRKAIVSHLQSWEDKVIDYYKEGQVELGDKEKQLMEKWIGLLDKPFDIQWAWGRMEEEKSAAVGRLKGQMHLMQTTQVKIPSDLSSGEILIENARALTKTISEHDDYMERYEVKEALEDFRNEIKAWIYKRAAMAEKMYEENKIMEGDRHLEAIDKFEEDLPEYFRQDESLKEVFRLTRLQSHVSRAKAQHRSEMARINRAHQELTSIEVADITAAVIKLAAWREQYRDVVGHSGIDSTWTQKIGAVRAGIQKLIEKVPNEAEDARQERIRMIERLSESRELLSILGRPSIDELTGVIRSMEVEEALNELDRIPVHDVVSPGDSGSSLVNHLVAWHEKHVKLLDRDDLRKAWQRKIDQILSLIEEPHGDTDEERLTSQLERAESLQKFMHGPDLMTESQKSRLSQIVRRFRNSLALIKLNAISSSSMKDMILWHDTYNECLDDQNVGQLWQSRVSRLEGLISNLMSKDPIETRKQRLLEARHLIHDTQKILPERSRIHLETHLQSQLDLAVYRLVNKTAGSITIRGTSGRSENIEPGGTFELVMKKMDRAEVIIERKFHDPITKAMLAGEGDGAVYEIRDTDFIPSEITIVIITNDTMFYPPVTITCNGYLIKESLCHVRPPADGSEGSAILVFTRPDFLPITNRVSISLGDTVKTNQMPSEWTPTDALSSLLALKESIEEGGKFFKRYSAESFEWGPNRELYMELRAQYFARMWERISKQLEEASAHVDRLRSSLYERGPNGQRIEISAKRFDFIDVPDEIWEEHAEGYARLLYLKAWTDNWPDRDSIRISLERMTDKEYEPMRRLDVALLMGKPIPKELYAWPKVRIEALRKEFHDAWRPGDMWTAMEVMEELLKENEYKPSSSDAMICLLRANSCILHLSESLRVRHDTTRGDPNRDPVFLRSSKENAERARRIAGVVFRAWARMSDDQVAEIKAVGLNVPVLFSMARMDGAPWQIKEVVEGSQYRFMSNDPPFVRMLLGVESESDVMAVSGGLRI